MRVKDFDWNESESTIEDEREERGGQVKIMIAGSNVS